MPNTPALNHYSRVITTKRAGKCHTCAAVTSAGRDYAAVNANGTWFAYCQACAGSFAAQAAGLVKRVEAAAADATPEALAALTLPDEGDIIAVIKGTRNGGGLNDRSDAEAYDVVLALLSVVDLLALLNKPAPVADPLVDKLRTIAADASASPRNRDFASSLVSGYERFGSLTPNQRNAAEGMVARLALPGTAPAAAGAAVNEVGVYVNAAGTLVKVQRGRQSGKLYAKVWTGAGFEYQGAALVSDTSLRPITADEAAAFGHQHDHCVFCYTPLSDDRDGRSVQVGYGPVCANNYGLPWG